MKNKAVYFIVACLVLISACVRREIPEPTETTAGVIPTVLQSTAPSVQPTLLKPTVTISLTPTLTQDSAMEAKPFMGIQVNRMDQKSQADRFKESGAEWSRHDYMRWEEIEPENTGVADYRWETVNEDMLLAAVAGGQQTIANILYTPAWAQKYPGIACGPIAQEALDDFAEFMNAVVKRYSVPPYNVKYWEIGNEPDIDRSLVNSHSQYGCWGEADDPYYGGGYYAEMLKEVYPAVKAADPDSKLIVGGLVLDCDPVNPPETAPNSGEYRDCTPTRFLEGIIEAGAGDYFDGISFHAYDYYYGEEGLYGNAGWHSSSDTTGPVVIAKTRYLRSLLNTYGFADKELLNTELAVLCGRDGKEDYCLDQASANTKEYYVSQANAAALAEGLHVNLWYSLTGWRGSSLVDEKLEPLPAFMAYQFAASQLNEAAYQGEVDSFSGVMGYEFENKDKNIWIVWSLDGENHIISLSDKPSGVYDAYGNSMMEKIVSDTELDISIAPVYVEWGP
jgi:hypothetical protein